MQRLPHPSVTSLTSKHHSRDGKLHVGVVGYSSQSFDQRTALLLIQKAFDSLDQTVDVAIISGLTQLGVPALAYEESVRRGWQTVGVACKKAFQYPCFPVDDRIIVGDNWGDESSTFLNTIDVLIRIGGGTQSHLEARLAKSQGKCVMEFELPALISA